MKAEDWVVVVERLCETDPPIGSLWQVASRRQRAVWLIRGKVRPGWVVASQLSRPTPEEMARVQLASLEAGL